MFVKRLWIGLQNLRDFRKKHEKRLKGIWWGTYHLRKPLSFYRITNILTFSSFFIKVHMKTSNIQCCSGFQRKPGGLRMNKRTNWLMSPSGRVLIHLCVTRWPWKATSVRWRLAFLAKFSCKYQLHHIHVNIPTVNQSLIYTSQSVSVFFSALLIS